MSESPHPKFKTLGCITQQPKSLASIRGLHFPIRPVCIPGHDYLIHSSKGWSIQSVDQKDIHSNIRLPEMQCNYFNNSEPTNRCFNVVHEKKKACSLRGEWCISLFGSCCFCSVSSSQSKSSASSSQALSFSLIFTRVLHVLIVVTVESITRVSFLCLKTRRGKNVQATQKKGGCNV